MSRNKRFQIKRKQEVKRRKRRHKLKAQNLKPNDYFYSGYFVGTKK